MKEVTIIIPVYKGKELTEKCLQSIYQTVNHPYNIIIIADEITNEHNYKYLIDIQKTFDIDMQIILRKKRQGVLSAFNLGMKISKNDVLFTQNDVTFPKLDGDCWLTRLVKASNQEDVGLIGCENSVLESPEECQLWVGSWCCYILRETINEVGYLDERFGWAMMDDIDYTRRVQLHNLKIIKEKSFRVEHIGSGTLSKDKNLEDELKKKAKEIYDKKWNTPVIEKPLPIKNHIKKYDYWG